MRKDQDLGNCGEYADHTRNTARGKTGVNRTKRHRVKQNLQVTDASASPKKKKGKKKWGIKCGKFCDWYATEKARDQAFEALEKANRLHEQAIPSHWWAALRVHVVEKVER